MKKTIALLSIVGFVCLSFLQTARSQVTPDSVYAYVPQMPEYPGGQKEILAFFIQNMRYPLEAYLNRTEGTVYVNFIVETDGRVSDVHVLKPLGDGCDEEAVRLVGLMNGWTPGELNSEKVRVRMSLPVYFKEELYPDSRICTQPDTMPQFPGGPEALINYLQEETKIPPAAQENDITGEVGVEFVVEKNGSVTNIIVVDSLGYGCDEEAVRVISEIPLVMPGYLNGSPVRTLVNMTVEFNKDKIYSIVKEMPSFPGGMEGLMNYVAENIKHPEGAREKGIQGRVLAQFVIEKDGSISNIRILKGLGGGYDQEVVRMIKNMPKWTPGKENGETVRVKYTLPVKFTTIR